MSGLRLELEPRPKLHSTEIVGGGSNVAKSAVSRPDIREGKALMIEGIEHFGAHLEYLALADLELLGKRSIHVADAVASQVGEVPGRIAGNVVAGIGETVLIQVREASS